MNWRSVSSRALRKRRIQIDSCVHRGATVLPFFNREAEVSFCMVVLPSESRLYFFTPQDSSPRVPWMGTIRLERAFWSWSDGDYVPALDGMWHFDPDWLLRDERFAGMEITPAVRKTNCCKHLPIDVNLLHFGRDLLHVRSASRGTNEERRTVSVSEFFTALPTKSDVTDLQCERGWRLNPTWST